MNKLAATKIREQFSEALNRVVYGGEQIVIERSGKEVAVLVALKDWQYLKEQEKQIKISAANTKIQQRYSKTFERLANE